MSEYMRFSENGTVIGSITQSRPAAVFYVTTSDRAVRLPWWRAFLSRWLRRAARRIETVS